MLNGDEEVDCSTECYHSLTSRSARKADSPYSPVRDTKEQARDFFLLLSPAEDS